MHARASERTNGAGSGRRVRESEEAETEKEGVCSVTEERE